MSNFKSIIDALDKYAEQTGINLEDNPIADQIKGCDSPGAVLLLLQENLKAFKDHRDQNRKFIDCLSPVVQFVHAFSGILGEAAGLVPFQPAKLIFVGIDVLFTAADGVSASYDALLELFECLGNFLKRLHIYSGVPLDPLMTDIIAKIMVELISILVLAKKQISRGRLKQFAKKLLGDSEIENILKRLDRLTQEEARMTVAQTLAIVHGLLNNVKMVMDGGDASTGAIRRILVAMQEVASEISKMKRDQLQKDARSWISPPDPSKNHIVARRIHYGESAAWFTRSPTFKNWDVMGGLLWIHGKPGSGKSILCSSIIEQAKELRDAGLGLVAYYYFDFGDTAKQDVRGLLSSLVAQLCAKSDLCHDILSHLYSKHDAGSQLPDDASLTHCLKDMLKLPGQPPIYIIVDALDECPNSSGAPSPREIVLDLLEELVTLQLPNLRICVTSRPEVDIQEALGLLVSQTLSLHDEAGQKQDIIDYISFAVQSDKKMRKWRAVDRELVIEALSRRADGMFRWVFCQIEALRGCFPPALRRALDELPESLDATYERILLGIDKAKREYAYRLLQCLTVSIHPLRVEELAEVLTLPLDAGEDLAYRVDWRPEDAQQAVLSACSSLVIIVNIDGSPVVQFSHFSVKEFLMSSRLADAAEHLSRYHILPYSAHVVLSRACLNVLLNLSDQVGTSAVERHPFAIYAARYWVDHAKFEGVSSGIQDLMKRLFDPDKPYFATWVWIYDVDRPWKGCMVTVHPPQPEAKPLYYAALCGFRSLIEHILISHPADVNAWGGNYGTPLNAAFAKGGVDIALALLQNGANINALDGAGEGSLHRAALGGQCTIVKLLLEHQADVNIQTGDRRETPLQLAARNGERDVCRLLLSYGADVAGNDTGWTPFHLASRHGHLDVLQELLAHGADVNSPQDELPSRTPLHVASGARHLEIVQSLAQHGTALLAALDKRNSKEETSLHGGWTPLHAAAHGGHLDVVRLLLDLGIDVHVRNGNHDTPLILASAGGHIEVSRFLIERQSDVNSVNNGSLTSLHSASRYGHADVVQLLIDHGADVNAQKADLWSPLHHASANGHLKVVELLIKRGAEVDVWNEDQKTPLDLASGNGELEVAHLLVKRGSNVNSQDNEGWTPSHSAARNGHLGLVKLLLDSGADVGMRNSDEKTPLDLAQNHRRRDVTSFLARHLGNLCSPNTTGPTSSEAESKNNSPEIVGPQLYSGNSSDDEESHSLHSAVVSGRLDTIQRLLDRGIEVDERDEILQTPLAVASMEGNSQVANALIKYGADVNSREIYGWTPLHMAARFGHIDVAQLLFDNGADINATQREDATALHIASAIGHFEIVQWLLEHGAHVQVRNVYGKTPYQDAVTYGYQKIAQLFLEYDTGV